MHCEGRRVVTPLLLLCACFLFFLSGVLPSLPLVGSRIQCTLFVYHVCLMQPTCLRVPHGTCHVSFYMVDPFSCRNSRLSFSTSSYFPPPPHHYLSNLARTQSILTSGFISHVSVAKSTVSIAKGAVSIAESTVSIAKSTVSIATAT